MTTIQDRITENFRKQFYDEFGFCKNQYLLRDANQFILEDFKQFLTQSIKEVEEETRKEIINHIDFFADQSRWFVDEDNGVGPIIQTRVISVEDLQKELLSITNKEKQK